MFEPEPGKGGVCETCRDSVYPRISERGGKWSPLALGQLSIFCDVMLIPTILAIARGVSELRTVAQREREGFWHREHPEVRTGAVWGILLASLRPMFGLAIVAFALGRPVFELRPEPYVGAPFDELGEILDAMRSSDSETFGVAAAQLEDLRLGAPDAERILDAVDRGFGQRDPETESFARSRAVEAAACTECEAGDRLATLYSSVDVGARSAILRYFAARGTRPSLDRMVGLALTDSSAYPALLPDELRAERAGEAGVFLPPLLAQPDGRHFTDAMELAEDLCVSRRLGPTTLAPARERLISEWSRSRERLRALPHRRTLGERFEREWRDALREAVAIVDVLGCADAGATLREVVALGVPELSASAIPALLWRGETMPPAEIERVAADPLARNTLLDALELHVRAQLPQRLRSSRARAESALVDELSTDAFAAELDAVEWEEDVHTSSGEVVHIFRARFDRVSRYAGVGTHPLTVSRRATIVWYEGSEPWHAASPAELAQALVQARDREAIEAAIAGVEGR